MSVVAPPGYGKTLLLAEWAAGEQRPVAWLTLDDFDNVPSVFLSYLAAAIDRIHPVDPSLQAAIAASGTRVLAAAAPRLASELHQIGGPAVLVLDDVHLLVDGTCLDALSALLDHLPPGFQVALAARSIPRLPLARLRAERALVEIGQSDLALDPEETEALVAAVGQSVTHDQASALATRTEGWAAAIYLAALAGRRGDPVALVQDGETGPNAYVADYLRSELMERLTEDDVLFLTRSSVLDVVEAPVAEAVVGRPGAADRLRSLAKRNQLIVEVGISGEAYRYHNLLREFLAAELQRREAGVVPELHARAAAWYAAAGRSELAIEHALRGDVDAAARYVVRETLPALFGGHGDRLDRWLRTFEEDAFRRHPPLAVMGAWMHLLNGRAREAEHLATIAEQGTYTDDPGDGSASFASSRALLRAVMARHGPDDLLANASVAVASEPPRSPWRTIALLMLGVAHLLLDDEATADSLFADAVDAGAMAGSTVALASRAGLAIARGDWTSAERFASDSHARVVRAQLDNNVASLMTYAISARIAIHRGNAARARDELVHAQLVRPLASDAAPWYSVGALLELARAYLAISDPAGAGSVIAEAEAIARRRPSLGRLNRDLIEMRQRLSAASTTLAGSSALTAAELRILPILSTPLTFKEIGQRLYLSPHTVKSHAISIYGKLQAGSRSEAIERAIEIGLLEPFPTLPPANLSRAD